MMPSRQFVTTSLLTTLRLPFVSGGLGWRVGDNQEPAWTGGADQPNPDQDYPYVILYDIDGGDRSGDFADDQSDATFVYQATVVGRRRDQAQLGVDRLCQVVRYSPITDPSGMSIIRRELDPPSGITEQGTSKQRVFVGTPRFRLHVVPA